MRTLINSWSGIVAEGLAILAVVSLAAACGSSNQANQEETSTQSAQSPEERFDAFFDANYANLTVRDLQDNNLDPEGGCVTKGSITLADSQKQAELQNMTGDMGVHWKPREGSGSSSMIQRERAIESGASVDVEPITADTDPNSPVVGIEESVEANDWDEEHPGETPSDFGTGFTLFQSMGMEGMEEMGNMEGTESSAEYALHGYRDNNANGTFAPVDSNIICFG